MFYPETSQRIWLCTKPTDMRKSFNGLVAITRNALKEDPLSGELFVFINRRKTLMKILYFDGTGYCIWFKRLEQGQFNIGLGADKKQRLDWIQLRLILAGIKLEKYRQFKRLAVP